MKYIAIFTKWNGEKVEYPIEKEWIDDIVCAVKGQYYFSGNGITINGSDFSSVDICEEM